MRLFVAEKPSLGRAIAEALPGPHNRTREWIECAGGRDVVAWCAGHILETAPPDAYDAEFKRWRLEDLPIIPSPWKLTVSTPALLRVIERLLKKATTVVHAGDPDREGQLLVDEVLVFLGYRGPVQRLLVSDLRPEAIRTQLAALEPNAKFRPLYESALARQRADWLFGMNMTRLYTLLGRAGGYDGVLSVGRVQTPLLGLIVARDLAIEQFRPRPYFGLTALVQDRQREGSTPFRATWKPGAALESELDTDGRLLRRELAEAAERRCQGHRATVSSRTDDKKAEAPPLPYALADLQMDAGRRLGMSAQAVLDAAQRLYETHRLATYPRSDCAYLPAAHHEQAAEVLRAAAVHLPSLAPLLARADLSLHSKAWNDKKITAHHAIIPTPHATATNLSPADRAVYELIVRRYLAQFFPAFQYVQTALDLDIAQERFLATGRQILAPGWKSVLAPAAESDAEARGRGGDMEKRDDLAVLPPVRPGDRLDVLELAITDKLTQPPKPFTDASLIQAMCSIAKFVSDPAIKKILSEADGIGTPATRAAIVETLFARQYVERVKKAIVSTPTGRALVRALPPVATTPDMTAVWEAAMRAITDEQQTLDAFLSRVVAQLRTLIDQGKVRGSLAVAPPRPCERPGCQGSLRRVKGPSGFFWSCMVCRATTPDNAPAAATTRMSAPARKRGARRRNPTGPRGR